VIDVDPESVRRALKCKNFSSALIQSLQLNDRCLFNEVVEKIPPLELTKANYNRLWHQTARSKLLEKLFSCDACSCVNG